MFSARDFKADLANQVKRLMDDRFHNYTDEDGRQYEVQRISDTEIMVRVKHRVGGASWFKIKISEVQ